MLGTFEFQEGIVAIDCSTLDDFDVEENQLELTNIQRSENTRIFENVKVYPNPVQSILYLEVAEKLKASGTISIFDIGGNIVLTKKINKESDRWQVPVQSLGAGLYFVEVQSGNEVYRDRFTRL